MKLKHLLFLLIVLVVGISCAGVSAGTAVAVNEDTTVVKLGVPKIKPLPVVWKEEYEAGNVTPGDHTQHMLDLTYCESDPDRIYMGQDVCNIWVSRDYGRNWFTLRNEGLFSPFVISVEVDPLDKNRLLAATQCRHYDGVNQDYQGIYQSLDGGITWSKKISRTNLGEVRSSTKLITYAPVSKDVKLGYAKRWYAAFGEYKRTLKGNELTADDGLLYSDNGGESWKEIRKLPAATFGDKIRGIKVHANDQQKVFMYGNGGLFRFENATDPAGKVTKISGSSGLPDGDIWGRLFQSKEGSTLIVAVSGKGIYKSVDAGANWAILYNWADVNYCYVNENFPDKLFAVPLERSQKQIRVSSDGGKTWIEPADENVHYRAGYGNSNWVQKLNGQFTCIIPDPRNANNVFIHTKSKNFRSSDGGLNWEISDNGYNGSSHTGINNEQMFDAVNPDRFCYFMVDKGAIFTNTKGRWFYQSTQDPKKLHTSWKTSVAGALHSTMPVILASVGESPKGKLLRSADDGVTWKVVREAEAQRWVIAFDLDSSNYCYQGRERSM
ncbi:MAG: sialidase family protein [Niabella sp.]